MDKTDPAPDAGPLGLLFFLASLLVLFLASLAGVIYVRLDQPSWPPPGLPPFPQGLWLSTGLLLVSSATVHWALRGARRDNQGALRAGLTLTLTLAGAFLVSQVRVWQELAGASLLMDSNLYGFAFYLLTALHGLHVLGGLLPLGVTTGRAWRGRYGPGNSQGVLMISLYWHFLDAVWLGLCGFLWALLR